VSLDTGDPALACALAHVRRALGDERGAAAAYDRLLAHGSGAALEHALVEAACFHLDERDDGEAAAPFVEALTRRAPADARLGPLRHRLGKEVERERERAVDDEDVDAHARTELVALPPGDVHPFISATSLDPPEAFADAGAETAEAARARYESLRKEGRDAEAALALARVGALLRDTATLRAAVDLAERVGDRDRALDVVELALRAVGDGPARDALLRRRARIEAMDE
jgi:hypothetical protein